MIITYTTLKQLLNDYSLSDNIIYYSIRSDGYGIAVPLIAKNDVFVCLATNTADIQDFKMNYPNSRLVSTGFDDAFQFAQLQLPNTSAGVSGSSTVATNYKILGQSQPTATILTNLYAVPVSKQAVASSINVCNQSNSQAATFRISVAPAGVADSLVQYIYYNLPLSASDTFVTTIGITLSAGDVIRCYSSTSNLSFHIYGMEIG